MCRCNERGEILKAAAGNLASGDVNQLPAQAGAFVKTVRDDAADMARASTAAVASALARLGGFR